MFREPLLFIVRWHFVARDPSGRIIWQDEIPKNLVVDEGANYLLDVGLAGNTANAIGTWYIGLTSGAPSPAASDTMASHPGWTEVTAYSETTRQAATLATPVNRQTTNSASPARFTINADGTTIGGAFLTSDATKGGTTGTLFSAGAASGGDQTLSNGSTLDVTVTITLN